MKTASALQQSFETAASHARNEYGDLVRVLLNSRSAAEASLAVVMLRDRMSERDLVSLCNLRELISVLPSVPFTAPSELSILSRTLGYKQVGMAFSLAVCEPREFPRLEFVGDGNRVDSIVLHTANARIPLAVCDGDFLDPAAIDAMLADEMLGPALVGALHVLGVEISAKFYMSVTDYVLENTVAALDDIEALF